MTIRSLLEHAGIDTAGRNILVGDRVVDEWPPAPPIFPILGNLEGYTPIGWVAAWADGVQSMTNGPDCETQDVRTCTSTCPVHGIPDDVVTPELDCS